jgi:hypothetical protein
MRGMLRSSWIVLFVTYHDAPVMPLSVFDWNVWRILVLEGRAQPDSDRINNSLNSIQTGSCIYMLKIKLLYVRLKLF